MGRKRTTSWPEVDRKWARKSRKSIKPDIRFWKGSSQPYSFISFTPKSASFVKLILSSFNFICCWLKSRVFRPMRILSGIRKNTINPSPANVEIPSSCHKKYIAMPIWNGDDHRTLMKAFKFQFLYLGRPVRTVRYVWTNAQTGFSDLKRSHKTVYGLTINWHQIYHSTDWTISFWFRILFQWLFIYLSNQSRSHIHPNCEHSRKIRCLQAWLLAGSSGALWTSPSGGPNDPGYPVLTKSINEK